MEIMSMPASNESDGQHHIMLANQNLNSESAETASDQAQGHEEEEEIDFRYKKGRDKPSDVRNVLLTVAVLLVAATYQAVYNPPGGLWQEDCPDTDHVAGVPPSAPQTNGRHPELGASTTARSKQVAGVSILATKNIYLFNMFIFGNTLGFLFSMLTIEDLTSGFTRKTELNLALSSISFTYGMCVQIISPSEYRTLTLFIFFIALALALAVRIWRGKCARRRTAR